jgi:hypothetical protein
VDNFLGFARCDAMVSCNLVHCRRGSHNPVRHPELVSGSYYFDVGSKILKRVQDDGVWDDGVWDDGVWDDGVGITGGGRQGCRDEGGPSSCLSAFVRDTLAQRLVLAGLCARALWARGHPARPFALSGVYRTCHRNSSNKSRSVGGLLIFLLRQ